MLYKLHHDELKNEKYPLKKKNDNCNEKYILCLGIIVYTIGIFIFLTIGYTIKLYLLPDHHIQLTSFVEP